MARIQKAKSCSNCRFSDNRSENDSCIYCLGLADYPYWKSRRGAKAGAYRKEGAGRTPFEDRGQLKQNMVLSFKESDITKAGGYKKVHADLEKAFHDKLVFMIQNGLGPEDMINDISPMHEI